MSELSPAQAEMLRRLGPLEGERVPGGCDRCDAYQTVASVEAGLWKISVHHDPECPVLTKRTARQEPER